MLKTHPPPVVSDPDLSVLAIRIPAWEGDRHARGFANWRGSQEVVECVIDELRQALPRRELDISQDRKQPRMRRDVDGVLARRDRDLRCHRGTP